MEDEKAVESCEGRSCTRSECAYSFGGKCLWMGVCRFEDEMFYGKKKGGQVSNENLAHRNFIEDQRWEREDMLARQELYGDPSAPLREFVKAKRREEEKKEVGHD